VVCKKYRDARRRRDDTIRHADIPPAEYEQQDAEREPITLAGATA
jgi:hypothetical protein